MKTVMIAGVVFDEQHDGTLKLRSDDVNVIEIPDNAVVMTTFNTHDGFNNTYVVGEWCQNGCQTFHKSQANRIFTRFNVPDVYRNEIQNSFNDIDLNNCSPDPLINLSDQDEDVEAYTKLMMLNGASFDYRYFDGIQSCISQMTFPALLSMAKYLKSYEYYADEFYSEVDFDNLTYSQIQELNSVLQFPECFSTELMEPFERIQFDIDEGGSVSYTKYMELSTDELKKLKFTNSCYSDLGYVMNILRFRGQGDDVVNTYIEKFKNTHSYCNDNGYDAVYLNACNDFSDGCVDLSGDAFDIQESKEMLILYMALNPNSESLQHIIENIKQNCDINDGTFGSYGDMYYALVNMYNLTVGGK